MLGLLITDPKPIRLSNVSWHRESYGFDPNEPTSGFGLIGICERVELVRGSFQLESEPEAGTTLHVVLPISEEAADPVVFAS